MEPEMSTCTHQGYFLDEDGKCTECARRETLDAQELDGKAEMRRRVVEEVGARLDKIEKRYREKQEPTKAQRKWMYETLRAHHAATVAGMEDS